jgi:hypothetical protein
MRINVIGGAGGERSQPQEEQASLAGYSLKHLCTEAAPPVRSYPAVRMGQAAVMVVVHFRCTTAGGQVEEREHLFGKQNVYIRTLLPLVAYRIPMRCIAPPLLHTVATRCTRSLLIDVVVDVVDVCRIFFCTQENTSHDMPFVA